MKTGGAESSDSDSGSGSVYWLNFKPESDEVLQDVAKTYTEQTGVPVKVVTAASGTYSTTLLSEMDKSAPPTLFVIGNQEGVKSWAEYALDLTGTPIANELNTDAYNLYDESGKLVSIGYCYECYGIIVNPDLIEAAGHTMALTRSLPLIWMILLPGVLQDIWQIWSIIMNRKAISGQSARQLSPESIWITLKICMTSASTTA